MADEEEIEEITSRKKVDRPPRQLVIRECDMSNDQQSEVIEFAHQALDDHTWTKNMAQHVKKQMDERFSGTWHVIVGSNFAGNVTSDSKCVINFSLNNTWFLVFRSGPPEKSKPAEEKGAQK